MDDFCPQCGAATRPDQAWCTLCLHVLHAPEPVPTPAVVPVTTQSLTQAHSQAHGPADPQPPLVDGAGPVATPAASEVVTLTPEQEAAADRMLAQLAASTRQDRLNVPSFLDSKAKVVMSVSVGMCVFSAVVLVAFSLVGALLH